MAPKLLRRSAAVAAMATIAAASDEPDIEDFVQTKQLKKSNTKKKEQSAAESVAAFSSSSPCDDVQHHHEAVHDFDMKELRDVRTNLLHWYDAHRRKLPWRGDPPPYLTTATHTKQSVAVVKKTKRAASGAMDAFVAVAVKTEVKQPLDDASEPNSELPEDESSSDATINCEPPRKVSPYETWVSEIMLQQTRVDTVVDYFVRWTTKFPTVEALASGSEEDVNALWAGLGYYRRARMLHAGAKYVVEHFGGELPSSIEQLLTIPGIGPYTAGAISSIAFGNCAPLVDGNVIRVLARLRAVGADPKNKQLIKFSWKAAGELVNDCDRPGALNQALMELGATVCTVQNPSCMQCPVRTTCLAYEETQLHSIKTATSSQSSGECSLCDMSRSDEWRDALNDVAKYPLRAKKSESKNEVICVSVVSFDERGTANGNDTVATPTAVRRASKPEVPATWKFLMAKRPAEGLLAGQWEFIHTKVADGVTIPSFAERKSLMDARLAELLDADAVADIAAASSSRISRSRKSCERCDLGELTHIFSHVKHHMGVEHVHLATASALRAMTSATSADVDGTAGPSTVRWMNTREMQQLGITTGVKKILGLVAAAAAAPSTGAPAAAAKLKRSSSAAAPSAAASKSRSRSSAAASARSKPESSLSSAPKRMKTLTSFFKK